MQIKIKATNLALTPSISDYAKKRVEMLEKFIAEGSENALIKVEVGKTTQHHKRGEIFRAEINASIPRGNSGRFPRKRIYMPPLTTPKKKLNAK